MPKPISSSDWTGPPETGARQSALTYRVGQHSISSDYQRILASQRTWFEFPTETRGTRRLAAWLLLSPVALWLAWLLVGLATPDFLVQDNRHVLITWGLSVMALAAWQFQSQSIALVKLRNAFLAVTIATTLAVSIAYGYAGIDAHAHAMVSPPERSFELTATRGHRIHRTIIWHQLADGSNVEGHQSERPLPYSHTCALVQRLDGPNGSRG